MYKLLLCWRYLLTRYLAMVCIVSVMLGVATLIVVNSVMSGFSTKLQQRLHGLLSDIVIESFGMEGFGQPKERMDLVRADPYLGPRIAAMSPAVEVFAIMQFKFQGESFTKLVHVIGIDPKSWSEVGEYKGFLQDPRNRESPSFDLSEEAKRRYAFNHPARMPQETPALGPDGLPPPDPVPEVPFEPQGIIVGKAIINYHKLAGPHGEPAEDIPLLQPGDDIHIYTISGQDLSPVHGIFALTDSIKTEMSEYDGNYVYVSLDQLQELRTMEDRVTSIHIRLNNYDDAGEVVTKLKTIFDEKHFQVQTWEEKQGPLLGAIAVERSILNILLFLIIAVAGFCILAIFSMIVVEKTRDIGILKALGASNGGVMKIFLGYGLLLGLVGAALGTGLGLFLTYKLNAIEKLIARSTGHEIFDRKIYYFNEIPTNVQGWTVVLVNLGALTIAVAFSVLPALRAAMLHPVRALRYE